MRYMIFFSALLTIFLSACLHEPIHQGNRLGGNEINLIQEGDTKFTVEQKLGTPALSSTLHPHRVTYFEEFEDEDSGDIRRRGVEINYDDAWRTKTIRRFGFEEKKQASKDE